MPELKLKLVVRMKPKQAGCDDKVYWFSELLTAKNQYHGWEIYSRYACYYEHEPDKHLHWDGKPWPNEAPKAELWGKNYRTEKDAILDALANNGRYEGCQTFSAKAAAAVVELAKEREVAALADKRKLAEEALISIKEDANVYFRDRCRKLKPQNHEKEKKKILERYEPQINAKKAEIAALDAQIAELTKGRCPVRAQRKR